MRQKKNPTMIVFAIVVVCAVIYAAWQLYMKHETQEQSRAMLAAPPPSGLPDIFQDAPPPKQP